jgi:hypothetical protein
MKDNTLKNIRRLIQRTESIKIKAKMDFSMGGQEIQKDGINNSNSLLFI